jgi:hypothetical protein
MTNMTHDVHDKQSQCAPALWLVYMYEVVQLYKRSGCGHSSQHVYSRPRWRTLPMHLEWSSISCQNSSSHQHSTMTIAQAFVVGNTDICGQRFARWARAILVPGVLHAISWICTCASNNSLMDTTTRAFPNTHTAWHGARS